MWVIAIGDPFAGLNLCGPYDSRELALKVAEDEFQGATWWVIQLDYIKPTY